MTRSTQKLEERAILDRYLSVRGLAGVVRDGLEPPDLLVMIAGETFGCEITQYHTPQPTASGHTRRQVEAAWEELKNCEAGTRTSPIKLNVFLNFTELRVPAGRKECREFIKEVRSLLAEADISPELKIGPGSPKILREYLLSIYVEKVNCWMEWDWNHIVARVGVSEDELFEVIEPKLRACRRIPRIDKNHLIVAGFSSNLSEFVAIISAQQLNGYARLNAALEAGEFDEVAIIDRYNFVWTKTDGWRKV